MAVHARRASLFVRDICATFFNVSDRLGWASLCAEQMNYGSISTIRAFRDWKGRMIDCVVTLCQLRTSFIHVEHWPGDITWDANLRSLSI